MAFRAGITATKIPRAQTMPGSHTSEYYAVTKKGFPEFQEWLDQQYCSLLPYRFFCLSPSIGETFLFAERETELPFFLLSCIQRFWDQLLPNGLQQWQQQQPHCMHACSLRRNLLPMMKEEGKM